MERHLAFAGRLLLGSCLGYIALAVVLERVGYQSELALIPLWCVNFVTASYMAKAAKALGKNGLLYGLVAAIAPAGSIFGYFMLYSTDHTARLDGLSKNAPHAGEA
jgi:hypothetical protein